MRVLAFPRAAMPWLAASAMLACQPAHGVAADAWALNGDIGLGAVTVQGPAPGQGDRTRAIPYVYADLGPLFAREDTVGVKLLPVGWGSLEVAARISSEGADSAGPGLASRRNPRPVGLGTFQETPWGGVFLDAFEDTVSGGNLLEASYAAEVDLGRVTLYPQAGVIRRSARYVDHLYGVSAAESQATGQHAYAAGASTVPLLALSAELTLAPRWVVVGNLQLEAFDRAIGDSPRVGKSSQTAWLVALARRFD